MHLCWVICKWNWVANFLPRVATSLFFISQCLSGPNSLLGGIIYLMHGRQVTQARNQEFSRAGVQSMKRGTSKLCMRRYSLLVLFFRSISGGSTAIVPLKPNDSCCQFLSWEGRKKGAGNEAPENFNKHAIFILGKRPFWYRECTTKGAILFICWKWQGSRPPCTP